MDQPKIERMLRLMMMLIGNRKYTVDELGDKLEMSRRTIYRYIDTFRESGFVVKKDGECFRLDKSSPYFKDISELVHFTDEEAYILKSAIEGIDENNVIKQNLKKKLYSVYDYRMLSDCVVKKENAANVHNLTEAVQDNRCVVLHDYHSNNSGKITDREVEPFAFTTNYVQLWAYEPASGKNKLFKVSRIGSVEILPRTWENEHLHEKHTLDIFRVAGLERHHVELELGFKAHQLLVEEFPLAETHLTQKDDSHWILSTDVSGFEGVARFSLGLMDDIRIIESNELREFIRLRMAQSKL